MTDRANIRVLLVEDNPGDARLVEILLSEAGLSPGFEVTHARRLDEALGRLVEAEFDIILLDLSLPDSSGLETVERTRATAPPHAFGGVERSGRRGDRAAGHPGRRTIWSRAKATASSWRAPFATP